MILGRTTATVSSGGPSSSDSGDEGRPSFGMGSNHMPETSNIAESFVLKESEKKNQGVYSDVAGKLMVRVSGFIA